MPSATLFAASPARITETTIWQVAELTPEKWAKKKLSLKKWRRCVNVVAFAYDIYTNPSKTTGCSVQRLRFRSSKRPQSEAAKGFHVI